MGKKMKWIGKPKEDKRGISKTGIERKIAEWILDPDVRYPWEKRKGETELETHEQFLSMAGIMYCSLKENWNKASSDRKRIKETQQKENNANKHTQQNNKKTYTVPE